MDGPGGGRGSPVGGDGKMSRVVVLANALIDATVVRAGIVPEHRVEPDEIIVWF
jgi:hypothetical protein